MATPHRGRFFARLWQGWKRFGRMVGELQARALLTAFYFVIAAPFAAVVKLTGDPLALASRTPKGWRRCSTPAGAPLDHARRQF